MWIRWMIHQVWMIIYFTEAWKCVLLLKNLFFFLDDEVTIIYDLKLPYKCHFCSKKFKTEGSLRNHLNIHNLPNSIECRKCKILFKSGKLLKKHVRRTHPEEWENTCRVCGRDFKNGSELEIHFKDHNYKCSMCGKVFLTKSARKKHNQVHIEQRCYKCNLCGQEFLYERFLLAHLTVHNVTVWQLARDFCYILFLIMILSVCFFFSFIKKY